MNTQDELERMLTTELHDRADHLGGAGFGFAEVKGRAGRIRRNRRIAAGAGVAAALAIVIPTVVSATNGPGADREIAPAPSPDAPVQVVRTTLTLDGLERGEDPGVTYLTPDGTVFPGQAARDLGFSYNAVVPSAADGGYLAWQGSSLDVRYLSESFEPQGGSLTNTSFVSNPDQSAVAWTMPESGSQTLVLHSTTDPDGNRSWDFGGVRTVDPVDFVSDEALLLQAVDPSTGDVEAGIADESGITLIPGVTKAISANPETGYVAAQTRSLKDGSGCFAVLDPAADYRQPLWETCDNSLGAFSPDGEYVLASDAYQSGLGPTSISVLEASTGDLVATFTQASDTQVALVGVVWESDETFLAAATGGTTWTALRFGVDGSLEEALDPFTGDAFDVPIVFNRDQVRGY